MYSKYFSSYLPYQPPSAFNRILPLPPVSETELHGQLLDWASQYLCSKRFPLNLITILLKQLKTQFDTLEFDTSKRKEIDGVLWYNALDAKQVVINKVDEICLQYAEEYNPEVLDVTFKQPFYEIVCLSTKNGRRTLEDRFCIVPSLDHIFDIPVRTSYFAVFDGHDGSEAANYSAAQLHINIVERESFPENVEQAITEAFHATDEAFLRKCAATDHKSGTTLAITLFVEDKMYVAWAGDSQVVVCRGSTGVDSVVVPHKPGRIDEMTRIEGLGGNVSCNDADSDVWRVNGCLAVSRAIGDPELKKFIIPTPDIVEVPLDGTEEYIILATDGLWDDVSPQRCHQLIKSKLVIDLNEGKLCMTLFEHAKYQGSKDNTTIMIVFMKPIKEVIKKYVNESTTLTESEKSYRLAKLDNPVEVSVPSCENDSPTNACPAEAEVNESEIPNYRKSFFEPSSSGCHI